jgi:hypothetical protein
MGTKKFLPVFQSIFPTFLCQGNHDGYNRLGEDGLEYWEEFFGPHYYSFDYGEYHFVAVNSFDMPPLSRLSLLFIALNWGGSVSDEQLQWVEQDLAHSDAALTFMFMHHNPLWDTKRDSLVRRGYQNREALLVLIHEYGVGMVLAGHVHYDSVNVEGDTIFITTTTPESEIRTEDGYWGYRMIDVRDAEISSFNYQEPKYSIPSYRLNCSTWQSNNVAVAMVENDLEQDVNVLVKFLLPLGEYSVNYGEIVIQRDDGRMREVYVVAPVPRETKQIVVLSMLS